LFFEKTILNLLRESAISKGASLNYNTKIKDFGKNQVTLDDGKVVSAKNIVICTGAEAFLDKFGVT
jgi:thioredoxin reductase